MIRSIRVPIYTTQGCCFILYSLIGKTMWFVTALVAVITAFLCTNKRFRWIYILSKTYRRDFRGAIAYARLNLSLWIWGKQNKTASDLFSAVARKHPQKVAFFFEDETWTFAQAEDLANQIARYFKSQGFQKGDSVALLLENRAEYPCIWLGLAKLGVVTALINTNLVNDPLLRSITVAKCKAVIFGSNHANVVKNVVDNLKQMKLYQFHESPKESKEVLPGFVDLRRELEGVSTDPVRRDYQPNIKDPLLYIYTSGTTGLPKAALITNIRYLFTTLGIQLLCNYSANDIIYNPLPLYHSAGGMLGLGQVIIGGTTLAIRKKFSASNYWKDCARYKCTIAQYIGEMCRYLLATPQKEPVKHCVRAMSGNGLRPQIWSKFVEKFGVKEIYEFYGATEGISNIINIDGTVGSVGFVPRYCRWAYPVTLIRCDPVTGDPVRNEHGYCLECDLNEPGLVIGKINQKKAIFNFKGYSDEKATEKKILQNVFHPGDMYFNSGDILSTDEFGNFFFRDRTGDTFRWKGENVSTSEVEGIISNTTQLNDAVVFGVEIPGTEGKAGMAAIVDTNKTLDTDLLGSGLKSNLPGYAIPLFVRVMESVPMTGTYKMKKVELQAEGYNVDKIKDDVYFYNSKQGKYVSLTKDLYQDIMAGKISL